ncbi:MAG: AbrB/MazE/SpoVT family DNA-binding domain-containing protein [Chloroflexota bacterium]
MKATIGERGQVTIPKPLRDRMGMKTGQRVEIEEQDGHLVLRKVVDDERIARVYGTLRIPEGWDTDSMIDAMRGPAELPPEE